MVDDEYWDLPGSSLALKQPEGQPSRIDLIVYYAKLYQALAPGLCLIVSLSCVVLCVFV